MITTRLNEIINVIENKGIFEIMVENNLIEWLSIDKAKSIDLDYILNHSGSKLISCLINNLKDKYTYDELLLKLCQILITKYGDNWNKLYYALSLDYNPIENYDLTETEIPNITRVETPNITKENTTNTKSNNVTTNNVGISNKTFGFNSSNSVNDNESETTNNQNVTGGTDISSTDTEKGNRTYTETGNRETRKHGNIGVMSVPDQLEKEYNLRMKTFFDVVYRDLDVTLTLPLY